MPDDHSKLVPPLPIPNRTVKRLRADDSAATSVKVGHRQAVIPKKPHPLMSVGLFALRSLKKAVQDGVQCLYDMKDTVTLSKPSLVLLRGAKELDAPRVRRQTCSAQNSAGPAIALQFRLL
jgi:hypothetical protein